MCKDVDSFSKFYVRKFRFGIIYFLIIFLFHFTPTIFSQGTLKTMESTLDDYGIQFDVIYTADLNRCLNIHSSTNLTYLDVIDFMFSFDFNPLFSWGGARFSVDVMGIHGTNPSRYIGDIQGVSNIGAYQTWKFSELWFQQNLWDDSFSILAGIYDINSEFDVIETAGHFLNSSFGMGPEFSLSGINGAPTFPNPDPGLRVKIKATDNIIMQMAVFDPVPGDPASPHHTCYQYTINEGMFLAGEIMLIKGDTESQERIPYSKRFRRGRHGVGFRRAKHGFDIQQRNWNKRRRRMLKDIAQSDYTKWAIGIWHYVKALDESFMDKERTLGKKEGWGIYGLAEKMLISDDNNPHKSLSGFVRLGIADKEVSCIDGFIGCGLVWSKMSLNQIDDQMGLAVAAAHKSVRYQPQNTDVIKYKEWEIVIELSYRIQINSFLNLQPDVQYIINPGFNSEKDNSVVGNIRVEVSL